MKKIILDEGEYSFNASTKEVAIKSHQEWVKQEYLLLITNVTQNQILYNFGCDGYGGTISRNSITLEYDTTSMSNTDTLQIILYVEIDDAEQALIDLTKELKQLTRLQFNMIQQQIETNNLLKLILS